MKKSLASSVLLCLAAAAAPGSLCRAQEQDPARIEAEALGQAAEADRLFKAGDFAGALPLYEAERDSRAALGDKRYEAYAVRAIGCCHARLGNDDQAIEAWEVARELDSRREDRGFEGYDWLLIGNVELRRGRFAEAANALERSLPLLSQAIDRDHETDARRLLARSLTMLGRPERARVHLDRARELARALTDPAREADVNAEEGRVALSLDEPGPAAEWLIDARAAFQEQGRTVEAADTDRLLGDALLNLDRPEEAAARVEEASRAHENLKNHAAFADDLGFLAALKEELKDFAAACELSRRALLARREADDPDEERETLVALARYESLAGSWDQAGETLGEALKLVRRDGEAADQVPLLILASDVECKAGRREKATALLDEATRIASESKLTALSRAVAEARRRASLSP